MRFAVSLCLIVAVAATEGSQRASDAYRKHANTLLLQAMSPALTSHLGDSDYTNMQFRCRVDQHGRVQSVTLLSSNQPRSTSNALIAALLAAKLPPLPKAVIREQGRNWIDVDTKIVLAK